MHLIDSHCHLDFSALQADFPAVLARAAGENVGHFIVPGVNRQNWPAVMALNKQYSQISVALGIHPCFLDAQSEASVVELEAIFAEHHEEIVAVGEIGLDLYDSADGQDFQLQILLQQFALAKAYTKPVILHVRKAHDLMLQQLRQAKLSRGGVVHAFSGSEQQAREYIKLGFRLGVGGGITYPRASKLRRTIAAVPLESLVLETDSPDMPLCGFQGQTNYPERVGLVAQTLAELRAIPLEKIVKVTSANTTELFQLS